MNSPPFNLAIVQKLLPLAKPRRVRARLAAWLWFRPLRKPAASTYVTLCDASAVLPIDSAVGGPLRIWGTGASGLHVHLVHGWGGRWDQFDALIRACIAAGHTVVAQDFAGHGEAGGSNTDLTLWIAGLCRQLEAAPAMRRVYICHSLGLAPMAYLVAKSALSPAAVIAINPPTRFDFMLESFLRKVRLPVSLAPLLEKRVCARVPEARSIADVDIAALAGRLPLLYIADQRDREVPLVEHTAAQHLLGDRFITTRGFGHNRILASALLSEKVSRFLEDQFPTDHRT